MNIKNSSHYGDILAIPFFALLIVYFYKITNKSIIEYILFYFSIAGFLLDIYFSHLFLSRGKVRFNNYVYMIIIIVLFGFFTLKESFSTTTTPRNLSTTIAPVESETLRKSKKVLELTDDSSTSSSSSSVILSLI